MLEEVEGVFVQNFQCFLDVFIRQSQPFQVCEFYALGMMQEFNGLNRNCGCPSLHGTSACIAHQGTSTGVQ